MYCSVAGVAERRDVVPRGAVRRFSVSPEVDASHGGAGGPRHGPGLPLHVVRPAAAPATSQARSLKQMEVTI